MHRTPASPEALHRSSFLTFLSVGAIALVLVACLNYAVDPLGRFASPLGLPPVVVVAENRVTRAIMALPGPPDVLVLGSSHAGSLDAEYIRSATGMTAYNAYIAGSRVETICAVARFEVAAVRRWPKVLLIAADTASFYGELHDTLGLNPYTRPFLPYQLSLLQWAEQRKRSARTVLEWTTLAASTRSLVRAVAPDSAWARNGLERLRMGGPLARKEEYIARYQARGLDPRRVRWFTELVGEASREGAQVVVFLTPLHADLERIVRAQSNYEGLKGEVWRICTDLAAAHPNVHAVDLSTTERFQGDPDGFRDGVHTTSGNGRRMIDQLVATLKR